MTKKQTSKGRYDREYLELLIEEATADCYDEYEQAVGLFTIIGDELDLPFTTRVLGHNAGSRHGRNHVRHRAG